MLSIYLTVFYLVLPPSAGETHMILSAGHVFWRAGIPDCAYSNVSLPDAKIDSAFHCPINKRVWLHRVERAPRVTCHKGKI